MKEFIKNAIYVVIFSVFIFVFGVEMIKALDSEMKADQQSWHDQGYPCEAPK